MENLPVSATENKVENPTFVNVIEEVLNAEEITEAVKNRTLSSYFCSGEGLKNAVNVFGQSQEEIEKEFKNYKAKKVFSKMDYLILDTSICKSAFKKECETAIKNEFKSVTVLPNMVRLAKDYLKGSVVKVNALIGYPYGEDYFRAIYKSVGSAFLDGADGVTIVCSVYKIKSALFKNLAQEFKKIIKKARNRSVNVMFDTSKLSPTEIQNTVLTLVKILKNSAVIPFETTREKTSDVATIKEVVKTANGNLNVFVFGKISTAEDTVSVLSLGANGIVSTECPSIVKDAIKKLNA